MSYLSLTSDQTTVTYSDWFTYTINASFNGLYGPLTPVIITLTLPDIIEFQLPPVDSPLEEITEETVPNGTQITFDFGTITNTGVTVSLPIQCRFKLSAPDTSSFSLTAQLYINTLDSPYLSATGPEIALMLNPYYVLTMNTVVPSGTSAAVGGSVIYEVTLENIGDQWKNLTDYIITFDLDSSLYLTLDTSFPIVGSDISSTRYKDTRADGLTATLLPSGNAFTFTLPEYRGQSYRFYFRANISSDVAIGTNISWHANWEINGVPQPDAQDILRIVAPIYSASTQISGPLQIQSNDYVRYTNTSSNSGNQDLSGVMIECTLPTNERLLSFKLHTGSFGLRPVKIPLDFDYLLTYVTAGASPQEYPLSSPGHPDGYYNTSASTTIDLKESIPSDRSIHYLRWYLKELPVGTASLVPPSIEAYAADDLILGTEIFFYSTIYWDLEDGSRTSRTDRFATPVSLLSELYIVKHDVSPSSGVVPGDVLTFTSTISCRYSQLDNPVIMNLISSKLTFIQTTTDLIDSIYLELYSGLTGTTINSIDDADSFPFPIAELIENYNDTSDTLLRLSYKNRNAYSFTQNSLLTISFKARVNIGAVGSFTNQSILSTFGPYGSVSQAIDIYTEDIGEDIDGDDIFDEQMALSPAITITIIDFASMNIHKSSKGTNDSSYTVWPKLASSTVGGTVNYELSIINNGNKALQSIELIDIIPHLNDTGVILTNIPRESEFPLYQVTEVQTTLLDSENRPVSPSPTLTTYYSRSFDPVRFGQSGDMIGSVDDWSLTPPSPITELGAYKVITSDQGILPGQQLLIHVVSLVPSGVTADQVAWNSFAVKASYYDNNNTLKNLLPVEPQKAGVIILSQPDKAYMSGLIWFDANQDGLYTNGEPGVNDVGVLLYRVTGETAELVATTISTPNVRGEDGHFVFSGLDPGRYILRVAPDFYKYTFTPQHLENKLGSIANPRNGFTPIFTVEAGTTTANLLIGLSSFRSPEFIRSINSQANKVVRASIYSQMLLDMKLTEVISMLKPKN